jgi:tetratricopeptide (TPR) repeat protein
MQPGFGQPGSSFAATQAFDRGRALHAAGKLEPAMAAYRQAVALKPDFAGAILSLGIALKQSGRVNEALKAYRRAIAVAPDLAEAHYNLAIVLDTVGCHGQAADSYRRAIDLKPDFAEAYNNLGRDLQAAGETDAAETAFRRAIEIKPDHLGAMVNLAGALNEQRRHGQAKAVCRQALKRDGNFVPALQRLAESYLGLEQAEQALAAARRAVKAGPSSLDAADLVVRALRQLGRDGDIADAYQQAVLRNPASAKAHQNLALHHLDRGALEAALEVSENYLAREPGDTGALAMKATILAELGDDAALAPLLDLDGLIGRYECPLPPGYDDMGAFNDALAGHVLGHPSLVPSPKGRSTRAGRHTGSLLIDPKGPIEALEKIILANVESYRADHPPTPAHPFLNRPPKFWSLNVWSVVLGEEGYQAPHIHPSGWLSGVYYVEVPSAVRNAEVSTDGCIEFGRSGHERRPTADRWLRVFRPQPGLMLLFPSYFYHRTIPSRSEERRISIAFDVVPLGAEAAFAP